jgi:hypothetical protein
VGLVWLLGSATCALLLLWGSTAIAGTPNDLSRTFSDRLEGLTGVSRCTTPTIAKAPCAAPIQRVTRRGPQVSELCGSDALQETTVSAMNWAGYDATGGGFASVTASWVVPPVQASDCALAYASFWVGLDGDGSPTAEQTGTAACSQNGSVSYYAWYEMYPAAEVRIAGLSVGSGDVMTGTVTRDGLGTFTLTLVDDTTHDSFTTTQRSDAAASFSAEIVAEAPTDASIGKLIPLADFGTVDFTGCAFNGRPIGAFARNQIDMVASGGATLAAASALGGDGASFSVTECAGDTTPPTTTVSGVDDLWHNRPVTITLSATDNPGGGGVAYTEYRLDQGPWTRATSLTIPAPADHANDGSHAVLYRSVDAAGNVETVKICTVNIDTRAPRPVACRAALVTRGRRASLAYFVGSSGPGLPRADVTIKIRTSTGRLVRTLVERGVAVNTRLVARFSCRLAAGRYRFYVCATDAAGNAQAKIGSNRLTVT